MRRIIAWIALALSVILLFVGAWLATESPSIAYRLVGVSMGLIFSAIITLCALDILDILKG